MMERGGLLNNFSYTALQLVEMGLCSYHELKDGTLNFRDVIFLIEYAKVKDEFLTWKAQRDKLWQKQLGQVGGLK